MKKYSIAVLLLVVAVYSQGLPVSCVLRPDLSLGPVGWFGWSLASGDFNGDGHADIAVGSPRSDFVFAGDSMITSGRVDVYFGPLSGGMNFPDIVIGGRAEGDQFGISLSSAGDFNGDGYEDLLVGANVVEYKGGAYIFYGGPSLDAEPDVAFVGENIVDNFGYSCTGIGDQNGDGFGDILVGALYNDEMGSRSGRCYIYFGGIAPDTTADLVITGLDSLDDFGTSVSGPLDFNGDGRPDFLVGAVQAGGYWYKPGAGYLFYGGALLDDIPDLIANGAHPMEFFGNSVAALTDFNGDGRGDAVFAGYNHHEPPDSAVGRVLGIYGGGGGFTLLGDRRGQTFGGEIASAGDIDFDGLTELAVAQTYDPSGDSAGFVKIFGFDPIGGLPIVDSTCWNPAPSPSSWFGYRMTACEDLTGDGMRNFAIADPTFEEVGGMQGRVYIYNGWRDRWPIEAQFISPERGIISACPRQEFKIRLRHPTGLEGIRVRLTVASGAGELEYTLDSPQVFLEDDSTLVFRPSEDWATGNALVILDSAYLSTTGEAIDSSIANFCSIDLNPPLVSYIGDSTTISDRYPTFIWDIEESEWFNEVDTTALVAICGTDSVRPSIYYEMSPCNQLRVAVSLSDFGVVPAHGETITVCLDNVMDMPDTCGPNIAEPSCISRIFYRAWNTDLTFSSPGLSPTILTLGAEPPATDGYDPGLDIFMPPIPDSRVKASFALDDPAYPHFTKLLRDLRASEDDTLEWRIITQGEGEASVEWTPEELPVGVWLLNRKLDMRAYPEWDFALGETLSIRFCTGPKVLVDFYPSPVTFWNLFSLPIYPETYDPERIIGRRTSGYHTYAYSPEAMGYYIPERWPTGMGVWVLNEVWMCQPPNVLGGWPIDTMWAPLSPGWNMISAPFDTTPVSAMATEPSGAIVSGTIFGWDFHSGSYIEATELAPLSGYWVAASREAELFAPGDGSALAKSAFSATFGSPPPPPSLTDIAETKPPAKPDRLTISAWPNPFNSAVTITLDAPVGAHGRAPLQIEIFDLNGRRVAQLPDGGTVGAGFTPALNDVADNNERDGARPSPTTREFTWSPDETIGSGVYLVRARFGDSRSLSGGYRAEPRQAEAAGGTAATKRVVYLK